MNTNRFETFFDAILAIIITVLALKLTQPAAPTLDAFLSLNARFITYAICYLVIFIIWYDNHNLFQVVEEIDNRVLAVYALQIFAISLLPYFASWLAFNVDSIPAETMFGIDFLAIDILYILSIYSVYRANPYNCGLSNDNFKSFYKYIPIAIMLLGFIITYTGFPQGIYVCVLISVVIWLIFSRLKRPDNGNTDRFEAFIDAIIAIIITIIVLDIPMVANGIGVALFFLSLIPYLTTFVGLNPDSFFPSFLYGLNFMIMAILAIGNARELKNSDPANIALQVALSDNKPFVVTIICVIIGMIIAYFTYPLIIVVACLVSLFFTWAFTFFRH